jgi:polysaccharide biosynthesis protein PelE
MQQSLLPHPQDRDVILALARHHEAYAASGFLDDARAQAELTEAIACCERVSAVYNGDPLVAETMARLFVPQGCIEKAMQQLQPLLASPAPTAGALANYCTCLFAVSSATCGMRASSSAPPLI